MALTSEQIAHPNLVDGSETSLHSHAGGGNGITTYYAESPGEDSTELTSWQEKLSYTVIEAGTYLVHWIFELRGDSVAIHCRSQVLHISGLPTVIANIQFEPEDVAPLYRLGGAGFRRLTLAVDDVIRIGYCSETVGQTTYIGNAAIFLIKL